MQELYQEHASHVFAVVRRLAGDEQLAEDLSQDVWIRVFEKLDQFRGDSGFGTWVHRIARNMALSRLRRRKQRPDVEGEASPGDASPPPEDAVINRRMLEEALERLSPGYRQVLVLHDVEGMTHQEIADELDVAVGTSKSQLHKARARMRELLGTRARADNGENKENGAG